MPYCLALIAVARSFVQSDNEFAYRIGVIIGMLIGAAVFCGLLIFAAFVIYKACTRRTVGWIILACMAAGCLSILFIAFCVGFVKGFARAQQQRQIGQGRDFLSPPGNAKPEQLKGKILPYTLTVPSGWTTRPPVENFDLLAVSRNGYAGVMAEEGWLGNAETLAQFAQENLRKVSTNLQLGPTTPVQIDGHEWRQYTARCEMDKIPLAYHCYDYAGPEGSYQIITWTLQNVFDRHDAELRNVAESFRFPPPGAQPAATPSVPVPLKMVGGNAIHYWLSVPSDWDVKIDNTVFDLRVSHGNLYLGVEAEEGSVGSPEKILEFAQQSLRQADKNVQFGEVEPVKIDGRNWLQFTAKCTVQSLPFAYQQYVYSGPEGTYRIVGWTMQNLYDRDAGKLRELALSFHFPHGFAVSSTPSPSATLPPPSSPAESVAKPTPAKHKRK